MQLKCHHGFGNAYVYVLHLEWQKIIISRREVNPCDYILT
jgi:hypothetical protein